MNYVGSGNFRDSIYTNRDGELVYLKAPAFPVASLDDLPAPLAGLITLPVGSSWQVTGTVNLGSNRIVMDPGSAILGALPGQAVLIGNSVGPLVSASAISGARSVAGVEIRNTAGPGLEFGSSVSGGVLSEMTFRNCSGAALRLVGAGDVNVSFVLIEGCGAGVLASGALGRVSLYSVDAYTNPAGFVAFDLLAGATLSELRVESCSFTLNNVADVGLRLNGSVTSRALISVCQIVGVGTRLTGTVSQSTIGWSFLGNQGLRESTVVGDGRFVSVAPVVVTTPAVSQWYAANTVSNPLTLVASERMVLVGSDTVRYVGIDPVNLRITAQVALEHSGGGSNNFEITCQRGTTPAIGSTTNDVYRTGSEVGATQITQVQTTFSILNVQQNDTFRVLIRNVTGTSNAEISSVALTISEA